MTRPPRSTISSVASPASGRSSAKCTRSRAGLGAGAAIGAAVAGPAGAAVGAGVGAYVGSLAGTLHGLEGRGTEDDPVRRPAGMVVAVRTESARAERSAIAVLRAQGAMLVEKAQGRWRNGKWIDFDPVSAPVIVPADAIPVTRRRARSTKG